MTLTCTARFAFHATDPHQLSLQVGDRIVVEQRQPDWWYGRSTSGDVGWFPATYAFLEEPPPVLLDENAPMGGGSGSYSGSVTGFGGSVVATRNFGREGPPEVQELPRSTSASKQSQQQPSFVQQGKGFVSVAPGHTYVPGHSTRPRLLQRRRRKQQDDDEAYDATPMSPSLAVTDLQGNPAPSSTSKSKPRLFARRS